MRVVISDTGTLKPGGVELHVGEATGDNGRPSPLAEYPLGRERAREIENVRGPNEVIGACELTDTGNTAIRVGGMHKTENVWAQFAYVVLTPADRRALMVTLAQHEARVTIARMGKS
jgi:hypothetical protein